MTRGEWTKVVALIAANWPHQPPPDASIAKWYDDLSDLDGMKVYAAVEAVYRDGEPFPPNGAQIRAKVIALASDVPEWAGVYRRLDRLFGYPESAVLDGVAHGAHPRADALAKQPPLIQAFVASVGWDQINAGYGDGGDEARLRDKWFAFLGARSRDAAYRGLPSAGLSGLERANQPRQVGSAIAQIRESR